MKTLFYIFLLPVFLLAQEEKNTNLPAEKSPAEEQKHEDSSQEELSLSSKSHRPYVIQIAASDNLPHP